MVDSIELRVGNILFWKEDQGKQKYVRVAGIKEEQFYFESEGDIISDEFNVWPVRLSEVIIEKLGFILTN